jgi:hypothetical protein
MKRRNFSKLIGLFAGSFTVSSMLSLFNSNKAEAQLSVIVVLKCLGHLDGNRWLDGRTLDGTVGLAPTTQGGYTGTKWQVVNVGRGVVALKCLGHLDGNRWLDGRTLDGTVGLAPTTEGVYTGTKWQVVKVGRDIISLKCLGHLNGNRWLDGRTLDGTVGLAPNTQGGYTGTRWQVQVYVN